MKLQIKITLCIVCLLSVIFGIGGSMLIFISFEDSLAREKESAFSSYQMALNTLQVVNTLKNRLEYNDVSYTLEQLSRQNDPVWAGLRLSSPDQTIYESGDAVPYLSAPSYNGDLEHCCITNIFDNDAKPYLQISGAFSAGSDTLYLDVAYDISPIYETRQWQQEIYQSIFLIMVVLGVLTALAASWVLTRPLHSLSRAARSIASGNYTCRAQVHSSDEIGDTARDFNHMAAALEQNIDELTETVRRQEVFLGSFAHEIKTPMTSIIGYADLLRRQTLPPEKQVEAANYIFSEGKRLESLSFKLLDILVLKHREVAFSSISLSGMVSGIVAHLAPIYEKEGIAFSYQCEEGNCCFEPDLVKTLLLNLLDNARKSLPAGGTIHLTGRLLPDGCEISVTDNGNGIPPSALPHLTEAFYRVDKSRSRSQGGTGLGLTLCKEIAALHHGALHFYSDGIQGCTVTVTLKGGKA